MQSDIEETITLFLSGDVMTGRGIDQVLPESSDPILYERFAKHAGHYVDLAEVRSGMITAPVSYDYIWGDAFEELELMAPDVRIINLETTVTTSAAYWPGKGVNYRMHPGNIKVLTEAAIDVCVMANNHCIDWGYPGLMETIQVLKSKDILVTGAGVNSDEAASPAIIKTKSGRLLVFSYALPDAGTPIEWTAKKQSPGVNLLINLEKAVQKVLDDVNLYRRTSDQIVISIHWGRNWGYDVPAGHRTFAHRLIDAGCADIIHGHSSHHPKGIEVYRGRLILYGCGDLINDYEGIRGYEEYRDNLVLMYFPVIDESGRLVSLTITPMKICRFSLHQTSESDRERMAERLNTEYRTFGTSLKQTMEGRFELIWKE